uniref:Uncharacterized protein n=1 Tax=Vitis vinifera TaxID=29760 RepID=F6H8W4_VITVI
MGGEKGVDGADGGELVGPVGEGIAGGGAVDSKGGRVAAGETSVRVAAELAVVVDGGRWWRRWVDRVLRTAAAGPKNMGLTPSHTKEPNKSPIGF